MFEIHWASKDESEASWKSFEKTIRLFYSNKFQLDALNLANNANVSRFYLSKICFDNVFVMKLLHTFGFENYFNISFVKTVSVQTNKAVDSVLITWLGLNISIVDQWQYSRLDCGLSDKPIEPRWIFAIRRSAKTITNRILCTMCDCRRSIDDSRMRLPGCTLFLKYQSNRRTKLLFNNFN